MSTRDVEFRVGVVVLLGIVLLAGSLYWLQDYQLERHAQRVMVRFDDVGTLAIGDKVTVSGVRKGKVSNLELARGGVVVELLMARDVLLTSDARFVIKNLGVMGERYIAVKNGTDSILLDLSLVIDGQYDTGLPEVMGLLGDMIVELRNLVRSFKNSIGSDSSLKKFDNTVRNLESVSSSLANYMKRHETHLDSTVTNFLDASRSLNRVLADNATKVDSVATRFDRMSINLEEFVHQLDTLSTSARQFADNLNNSEGTLQLLMEDRRLYDDLRKTADNVDDLINDIRANPRKYINLKVEIF